MVSSRTASALLQKKCKKSGLPHYLMRQPLSFPNSGRAGFLVGALHLPSPCFSVGPRQQCALKSGARPSMLAPCTPQALVPPLGYANPGAFFPARVLLCWRLAPGKPLRLRQATPTPTPFSRRAAFHVGALYPASPCAFVGPRQHRCRALVWFAPAGRQSQ